MKTSINPNTPQLNELLKSYYQGRLSKSEAHRLEETALEDEFLSEAMDGFNEFPEAAVSIPPFKPKSKFPIKWSVISSVVVISLVGLFFLLKPETTPILKNSVAIVKNNKPYNEMIEKELKSIIIVAEKTIEEEEKSTKALIPKTKKTPKPQENKAEVIKPREFFEIPKMELNPIEIEEKSTYTIKKAKTKALGYYTFLAVDYSVIYTHSIPVFSPIPTSGTDASMANKNDNGVDLSDGTRQSFVSYKTFLKESFYFLKQKNYNKAIANFKVILKHYPNDVNAEFYIGYALFNQGKNESAIPYFDLAINNGFDFFYEDAQWFKANCLENLGKQQEANKIYSEIKKKGGYYSFQVK